MATCKTDNRINFDLMTTFYAGNHIISDLRRFSDGSGFPAIGKLRGRIYSLNTVSGEVRCVWVNAPASYYFNRKEEALDRYVVIREYTALRDQHLDPEWKALNISIFAK